MYFDSFQAAMAMDGHGVFVWSAYGISVLVLALLLLRPWRQERRVLRELAAQWKRSNQPPRGTNHSQANSGLSREGSDAPGS